MFPRGLGLYSGVEVKIFKGGPVLELANSRMGVFLFHLHT